MKFTTKNRAGLISGIVATVLLSCAGPCFAQNVADAAKLERDRKEHSAHRAKIPKSCTVSSYAAKSALARESYVFRGALATKYTEFPTSPS